MKLQNVLALVAVFATAPVLAADKDVPDEKKDRMAYLTSVNGPLMGELCAASLPSFPEAMKHAWPKWMERSTESIARGKQQVTTTLGDTSTIEEFEKSGLDHTRQFFSTATREQQMTRCMGLLIMIAGRNS